MSQTHATLLPFTSTYRGYRVRFEYAYLSRFLSTVKKTNVTKESSATGYKYKDRLSANGFFCEPSLQRYQCYIATKV